MSLDVIAAGMKGLTLLGVLAAAAGLAIPRLSSAWHSRCFMVGMTGDALMFGNVLIADDGVALFVNLGYAALATGALVAALRESPVIVRVAAPVAAPQPLAGPEPEPLAPVAEPAPVPALGPSIIWTAPPQPVEVVATAAG